MQCRPAFHQHQWIPARPNDTPHNSAEMAERILMDNSWHAGKTLREPRLITKETNRRIPSFYSLYIFSIVNIMRQTGNIDVNLLTENSKQKYSTGHSTEISPVMNPQFLVSESTLVTSLTHLFGSPCCFFL